MKNDFSHFKNGVVLHYEFDVFAVYVNIVVQFE